jgi:hypothetical protein
MDSEFVHVMDYVAESFCYLLVEDSEEVFDSGSSRGSHHPSHKCFMVDGSHHEETTEGHVESIHGGEVTPPLDPDDEARANERVPPNLRLEQLWAWQHELEDTCLQHEAEHAELEHEIACRKEGDTRVPWPMTCTEG